MRARFSRAGQDEAGRVRTTSYNDFAHFRWLGVAWSRTPIFDRMHVGTWYCIEAHARLNDPDRANGVFELWIDGRLEARLDGLNWQGAYGDYGINTVFLENYWNDGAPKPQERYFDNFVVSTERIGGERGARSAAALTRCARAPLSPRSWPEYAAPV